MLTCYSDRSRNRAATKLHKSQMVCGLPGYFLLAWPVRLSQFVYPDTDAQLHDEHVIAVCEEVTFTLRYAAAMKSSFREVRGVDTALIRCYSSVCCVCRFRREAYG